MTPPKKNMRCGAEVKEVIMGGQAGSGIWLILLPEILAGKVFKTRKLMEAQAFIIARVLHMLGVVLWIGGVAMVTTVLLPAIAETVRSEERRVGEEGRSRWAP